MVRLGELDERSNPDCEPTLEEHVMTCADRVVDIPVIESIVHEKFDVPHRQNDIALLRLNTSIKPTGIYLLFILLLIRSHLTICPLAFQFD
jgi:hypothetical protein